MKEKKKVKRKLKFKGFLALYSIVLSIVMVGFLIYVADSLIRYEKNQTEKYIENTLHSICSNGKCNIDGLDNMEKSEFDKDIPIATSLEQLLKNADLKIEESLNSNEESPIYDVLANGDLILQVKLNGAKKVTRLSLLSFVVWKDTTVVSKIENGFYTYNIEAPSNYKVYVNDKELGKDQIIEETQSTEEDQNEALTEMAKYVTIPYPVNYEVKNLFAEPTVVIKDENGNSVDYETKGMTITKKSDITSSIPDKETALAKIENVPSILKIAEDWSRFLTQDLVSGNLNSYHKIKTYLVPNSKLDKYAYSWATSIDITFTSKHTLENPPFTNERLENFEIYSDDAFSCEIYLEKNMVVRGDKHKDIMHDRLYFVRTNGEWKLVHMQAITDKE